MGKVCKIVNIDGTDFIRANLAATPKMEYCIVRTYSAGVFAAYVESRNGMEAVLRDARRLWKWAGAMTLSDLSKFGPKDPMNCKFSVPVDREILTQVIEIIPITQAAALVIQGVPEWKS